MNQRIKGFLKRSKLLYGAHARVQDVRLSWESRRLRHKYAKLIKHKKVTYSEESICELTHLRMRHARTRLLESNRPAHVFCVGTDYEQERSGFIQGLAKLGYLTTFQASDQTYGIQQPPGPYDPQGVAQNGRLLLEQIDRAMETRRVDLLIGTMVARSLPVEALHQVRTRGIPVVNIAMDDRLPEHWRSVDGTRMGAIGLSSGSDLVLQTTREYVERYMAEGCPALYWPFGSDPDIFRPASIKDFDVAFVGNSYGWRGKLIDSIGKAGIAVHAFGRGFPNGHISAHASANVLGRSKIILGVGNVGHSSSVVTLKLRDFDGPMAGGLYLTTHNNDLKDLYSIGEEIVVYRSIRDCIDKIRYYLAHPEERERIARAGRSRALTCHTWDRRFQSVLQVLTHKEASARDGV